MKEYNRKYKIYLAGLFVKLFQNKLELYIERYSTIPSAVLYFNTMYFDENEMIIYTYDQNKNVLGSIYDIEHITDYREN